MATGYQRQSSAQIVSGLTVTAAAFNNEFNALLAAFDATTGHTHDGTVGGGAPIPLNGSAVTNTLPATKGGTGLSTYTLGDIVYSSASNTLAKLTGNTSTTKKYLSQTGDGTNSAAPAWAQINVASDVTGILPTTNGGTANAFFTVSGPATSAKTFTFPNASATVLTDNTAVTVAQGGTGATDASTARTNLGVAIGSDVQAFDADLTALAGLATTGVVHRTGSATFTAAAVDLAADVTGTLPGANGGTANAFFQVSGPATATKTFTFPNASATVLTTNAAVTATQGGTGIASYSLGDILYCSASNTLSKLTGNTTTTKKFLSQTGDGTNSAAPSWSQVNVSTDVTGSLPVANGGTGGTDAATGRTGLELGTAATQNTGTSGANVPLLNGANTWSATQTFATTNATTIQQSGVATKQVLQNLLATTTTYNTALAAIPFDNTIPLNTEGTQVLSQTITPSAVGTIIEVQGVLYMSRGAASGQMVAALFNGGTSAIIVGTSADQSGTPGVAIVAVPFHYRTTSASTTSITYTVRAGGEAANCAINGRSGSSGDFGGSLTSWMLVREISA